MRALVAGFSMEVTWWPVMVGSGGGGWWRRRRRKTKMLGMGGGAVGMLFRINSTK
jgi:hypothetical protein